MIMKESTVYTVLRELLSRLRTSGSSPARSAASDVELPQAPVAKKTNILPTFLTTADLRSDTFLPQADLRLANLDIETLRNGATTPATLRNLVKASPDLSASVAADARMGITSKYTVLARNLDGSLNPEGTRLVQQLCRRFDLLGPTDGGYNAYPSIRSASESLAREFKLLGAGALEVVLNKSRLPEALMPIAVDTIKFKYDKTRKIPYQVIGGQEISLDYPTFFYLSLDQSLRTAYADSPVESSIQPMLAIQDFGNDLRRVFQRAISPRIKALINEEQFRKTIPADVLNAPEKLRAYQDALITQLRSLIDGLNPEDALVLFDTLDISYLNNGATSLADEYKVFADILNGKLAAGAKTMPSVLGHSATSNVATTQAILFLKSVTGTVTYKLNEMFSRALTLCVRLYGVDAVVEFAYDEPELRPASELEAFRGIYQSRILEQLSLGQITDDEASLQLTGTLPPPGAQKLSGTMFKIGAPPEPLIANPESNTSALNQDLSGDAPRGVKSK